MSKSKRKASAPATDFWDLVAAEDESSAETANASANTSSLPAAGMAAYDNEEDTDILTPAAAKARSAQAHTARLALVRNQHGFQYNRDMYVAEVLDSDLANIYLKTKLIELGAVADPPLTLAQTEARLPSARLEQPAAYLHRFIPDSIQTFFITDVLNFSRDNSILLIDSERTNAMVAEAARAVASSEDPMPEIRRHFIRASGYTVCSEMLPIRESMVPFPYRAVAFVVPPWLLVGTARGPHEARTSHFSLLVYYTNESSGALRPRFYHYDSHRSQFNITQARNLLDTALVPGRIFSSVPATEENLAVDAEYDASTTRQNINVWYSLLHPVNALVASSLARLDAGLQVQSSCAAWSVAYAEKIQDAVARRRFSSLSSATLLAMNEACSTGLMAQLVDRVVLEPLRYEALARLDSDTRVARIETFLAGVLRFRVAPVAPGRLRELAREFERIYFAPIGPLRSVVDSRKRQFVDREDVNLHPDFIRLFLAANMLGDREEILFHTDLTPLAAGWTAVQLRFRMAIENELRSGGRLPDRVGTRHFYRAHRFPRLVVWLQLPEPAEDAALQYPMLVIARPLYSSSCSECPSIEFAGVYVYTCSGDGVKVPAILSFVRSISPLVVIPRLDRSGVASVSTSVNATAGLLAGVVFFSLGQTLGRYAVLHLLRAVLSSAGDLPDTTHRINALFGGYRERRAYEEQKNMPAGKSIGPLPSAQMKLQMFGRGLYFLTNLDQATSTDLDFDAQPLMDRSVVPLRDIFVPLAASASPARYGIKSDWASRTRLHWARAYLQYPLHRAIETAVYQATWRGYPANEAAVPPEEKQRLGRRLMDVCPCAFQNLSEFDPTLGAYWTLIATNQDAYRAFKNVPLVYPNTTPPPPPPPNTAAWYKTVNLRAIANYIRSYTDSDRPGMVFYQYPVIIRGPTIAPDVPPLALDIWTILEIVCNERFAADMTRFVSGKYDRSALYTECEQRAAIKGYRLVHHDPYLYIIVDSYNNSVDMRGALIRRMEDPRSRLAEDATLSSLSSPLSVASMFMRSSFADVALMAVYWLIDTLEK